jgi:hypothetical protein
MFDTAAAMVDDEVVMVPVVAATCSPDTSTFCQ